jgi:hypothetical protein
MEGRFVTGPQSSNSAANDGCAHEWEGIGQIDRRCKRCGKVESGLEASQSWPPVGRVIPNRVEDHNRRGKFGVSSVTMRPLNPAFPVMHAPEFPKWRVTFQDREWSFETMAEAQAFGLGFAAGKAAK